MSVDKIVNTTYGILEQALLELGFQARRGINEFGLPCVVYENKAFDAIIAIPDRPKEELMYGGHFLVAAETVEGRGVADRETFFGRLREAERKEAQAA